MLAPARSPRRTRSTFVEPSWNPGGTLVEPYLRAAMETFRSLSGLRPQSFQLLVKNNNEQIWFCSFAFGFPFKTTNHGVPSRKTSHPKWFSYFETPLFLVAAAPESESIGLGVLG